MVVALCGYKIERDRRKPGNDLCPVSGPESPGHSGINFAVFKFFIDLGHRAALDDRDRERIIPTETQELSGVGRAAYGPLNDA